MADIWNEPGVEALLCYLRTSEGEQHDVPVYDSGYDFDPTSEDAVRFIAGVVLTKSSEKGEDFSVPMPKDGTVVERATELLPENELIAQSMRARKEREKKAYWTYIPEAEVYSDLVIRALYKHSCLKARKENVQEKSSWLGRLNEWFEENHTAVICAVLAMMGLVELVRALIEIGGS